jgi:hypothetical protein
MEEALTQYLLAQAGLTALVGTSPARITWGRRTQGSALPAVVLHVISRTPGYTMQAAADTTPQRVQVDCWAGTYAACKAVARQVTAALSGMRETVGSVEFLGGFKESERDSFEQGEGADALHRCSMDFIIWTRED